jgi:hypothetical protein
VPDVAIVGVGSAIRSAVEVLHRAGFSINHALDGQVSGREPLLLGEVPNAMSIAREAVLSGRHLMIASPLTLPVGRLGLLLENRKASQALFVWSERRHHPGFKFITSLIEADATWSPRFLRLETLSAEQASSALLRWRTAESLALIETLTDATPKTVQAVAALNPLRTAPDLLNLSIAFEGVDAFVQIGLGEALERREALIAGTDRKAFVDELNQNVPVRLVDAEPGRQESSAARWVSCPAPTTDELARQQCLAFLEATIEAPLAQKEASLWLRSLALLEALERSLLDGGASATVELPAEEPRFRLITGRLSPTPPPSPLSA